MKTALELVERDLFPLQSTLRMAYTALQTHPDYGIADSPFGELLADVGTLLIDSSHRVDRMNEALDGQELAAEGGAA